MKVDIVTRTGSSILLSWRGHVKRMNEREFTKQIHQESVMMIVGALNKPKQTICDQIRDILE